MNAVLKHPIDFEAYGAAELKAVARSHLSRALAAGSGAWVMAFLVLAMVLARVVPAPPVVIDKLPPGPTTVVMPRIHFPDPTGVAPSAKKWGEVKPVEVQPRIPLDNAWPKPGDVPATSTGLTGGGEPPVTPGPDREGTVDDPTVWTPHEVEPLVLSQVKPDYPEIAKQAGVEGDVLLRVLVGRDGSVVKALVARSVVMLDEAALDGIRRWKFSPALQNGHPVAVWVGIKVHFSLH